MNDVIALAAFDTIVTGTSVENVDEGPTEKVILSRTTDDCVRCAFLSKGDLRDRRCSPVCRARVENYRELAIVVSPRNRQSPARLLLAVRFGTSDHRLKHSRPVESPGIGIVAVNPATACALRRIVRQGIVQRSVRRCQNTVNAAEREGREETEGGQRAQATGRSTRERSEVQRSNGRNLGATEYRLVCATVLQREEIRVKCVPIVYRSPCRIPTEDHCAHGIKRVLQLSERGRSCAADDRPNPRSCV
ncbi:MAG: hypothetical protein ABI585_08480 [Betaproteobacteria bacterium]